MKQNIHRIKLLPLDKLFSDYIRKRANGVCEVCGNPTEYKKLQTSHFFGRRNRQVRWNPDNAVAVCFGCHRKFHESPAYHYEWFTKHLGERFEYLQYQANMIQKLDLQAIELYLKEKIKEL